MSLEKEPSNYNSDYNSDTHCQTMISPSIQTEQPKFPYSYSQSREISHPIPVRGVGFGNVINPYNSGMPSTYSAKPSSPPLPSQATTHHSESYPQSNTFFSSDNQTSTSQQLHSPADQRNGCNSVDETENKQGNRFEEFEDQALVSHGTTNQSGNSSFCNGSGNTSHHHSQGSGCNNGSINAVKVPSECEESYHPYEGAPSRAMQREAALTKFRQKRKDRCFEKKVYLIPLKKAK